MRCPQFPACPVSRPVVCKSWISGELPERRSDMQISAERDVLPVLLQKRLYHINMICASTLYRLSDAINRVSSLRITFGSTQNRLEQAGISVLTQANKNREGILGLLR